MQNPPFMKKVYKHKTTMLHSIAKSEKQTHFNRISRSVHCELYSNLDYSESMQ